MNFAFSNKQVGLLLASLLCASGVWLYADRVLIPYQIAEGTAHNRPRGNFSDLYPQWIGARELLLHGRDPYSPEVTRQIQEGYYGRALDPNKPGDPEDQQAFAYPVYVVFYLAPTIRFPFETVRRGFFWVLLGLTLVTVWLWLGVLRYAVPLGTKLIFMVLTIGSLTVMQGLKLQQLTLLVAAMCAAGVALLVAGRPIVAGVVLALATIKPQLVLPLLLWLALWSLGDLRRRYRWVVSFLIVMTILCVASELLLPHWIVRFWHAVVAYRQYAKGIPVLEMILPTWWGRVLELLFAAMTALTCLRWFRHAENTAAFQAGTCLAMAVSVLLVPKFALYNQVLLLPAILLIVRDRRMIWREGVINRIMLVVVAASLAWTWVASVVLAGLSFMVRAEVVERAWMVPLATLPLIPAAVAALLLVHYYRTTFAPSLGPQAS
jgi:glycosyl transferase family 87